MKGLSLTALSVLVGTVLSLATLPSSAQAQASAAPTTIALGPATPSSAKGHLALSARLVGADGKPLSGQGIELYVPVELFGNRDMFIGSATTDSTGTAALGYQPAQIGHQTIVARFTGSSAYAPSEARGEIQVTEVVPTIKAEPLPFAGLREWLPIAMLMLVLIVWGVLFGVFVSTVQGIRRAT